MEKIFFSFALLAIICNVAVESAAQVTIGGNADPVKGALLDLNSVTKGGLLLPNVELTSLTEIPLTFQGIDAGNQNLQATKNALIGAVVYNKTCQPDGIYRVITNGINWKESLPQALLLIQYPALPILGLVLGTQMSTFEVITVLK
jgi:hypothetical protein